MKIKKFNSFINESKHNINGMEISCAYDLSETQINDIKRNLDSDNPGLKFYVKDGQLHGPGGCVWVDSYSFKLWQGDNKYEVERDVQRRFGEKRISVQPIYVK